jgi:hypothetical protein
LLLLAPLRACRKATVPLVLKSPQKISTSSLLLLAPLRACRKATVPLVLKSPEFGGDVTESRRGQLRLIRSTPYDALVPQNAQRDTVCIPALDFQTVINNSQMFLYPSVSLRLG